jgi:excisionase family DNA binding protein
VTPDYSAWFTKQAAADAIGVSTNPIEKLAQSRQIEQARWKRPTGGAVVAVFQPDDVARIAKEKHPAAAPFVLPAHTAATTSLVAAPRPPGDALVALAAALHAASENSQKPSALFLTLTDAATVSGLSRAYLLRLIAAGTLPAIRDRGWRIRRRDLEAL